MSRPWLTPKTTTVASTKLLGVSCSGLLGGARAFGPHQHGCSVVTCMGRKEASGHGDALPDHCGESEVERCNLDFERAGGPLRVEVGRGVRCDTDGRFKNEDVGLLRRVAGCDAFVDRRPWIGACDECAGRPAVVGH